MFENEFYLQRKVYKKGYLRIIMQKKGQVAIFVIIGIIIVVAFSLLFILKQKNIEVGKSQIDNEVFLSTEINSIEKNVLEECAKINSVNALKKYFENGGSFNEPVNFIKDNGKKYRILCQSIPNTDNCMTTPLLITAFSTDFSQYLNEKINNCINFDEYENKNYVINKAEKADVEVSVKGGIILIDINYPFTLTREEFTESSGGINYKIKFPIENFLSVINKIQKEESTTGTFNALVYQIDNLNKYFITVKKPHPDTLYEIKMIEYPDYIFYFAVEGQGRYLRFEGRRA